MSEPTAGLDAAMLLLWARWADKNEPKAAPLFRRVAQRIAPDVQLGDVVEDDESYTFNGVRRQNPFAR